MTSPVFLIAAALACATVLGVVKTIAGAFAAARGTASEIAELRGECEQYAAVLEDTQATLALQSQHIAELQERLDFTERLLAQGSAGSAAAAVRSGT